MVPVALHEIQTQTGFKPEHLDSWQLMYRPNTLGHHIVLLWLLSLSLVIVILETLQARHEVHSSSGMTMFPKKPSIWRIRYAQETARSLSNEDVFFQEDDRIHMETTWKWMLVQRRKESSVVEEAGGIRYSCIVRGEVCILCYGDRWDSSGLNIDTLEFSNLYIITTLQCLYSFTLCIYSYSERLFWINLSRDR